MPFFRYEDVYLGLLMIIRLSEERVHCELAWSPDSIRWERINPGTPFIPNAAVKGRYDWGCVYAADAPVVMKDRIRIYYAGSNGHHRYWRDGFLCLATLRPDGWAGYVPVDPNRKGVVVTQPLTWRGPLALDRGRCRRFGSGSRPGRPGKGSGGGAVPEWRGDGRGSDGRAPPAPWPIWRPVGGAEVRAGPGQTLLLRLQGVARAHLGPTREKEIFTKDHEGTDW